MEGVNNQAGLIEIAVALKNVTYVASSLLESSEKSDKEELKMGLQVIQGYLSLLSDRILALSKSGQFEFGTHTSSTQTVQALLRTCAVPSPAMVIPLKSKSV